MGRMNVDMASMLGLLATARLRKKLEGGGDARPPKPPRKEIPVAPVGRNEPCPCGSGKKFKRCCIGKYR